LAWWNPLTWGQRKSLDTSNDGQTTNATFDAFIRGESALTNTRVDPQSAYDYFGGVAAVGDAVRKISEKIKVLSLAIKRSDDDLEYNHEFLSLLKNPGEGVTGPRFLGELAKSYLLTSETWVVARGNVDRPPLALVLVRPYDVNIFIKQSDGIPYTITTTAENDKKTYYRKEDRGRIRYCTQDGLNEIFPNIAEEDASENSRGQSRLSGIVDDLEQIRAGKRHNLSLLKNGAKPSLVAMPKEGEWSKELVQAITKYFKSQQQGPNNAGNVFVQSKNMDIETFGLTNTDMDFANLQKAADYSIYNTFNIPLSLVAADTMTLDNYKIGIRSLYTEAVFPTWRGIVPPLFEALAPRYRDLENADIVFDPLAVDALRETHIDQMAALRNSRSVTVNEARRAGGFEDMFGGDSILVGANELPLIGMEGPGDMGEEDNGEN
jgi:HK97 family phage portal protein